MEPVIEINGLLNQFGDLVVHQDLDLSIERGSIQAIVGASGSGKTTLFHSILMLHKPNKGSIKVFDTDILHCSHQQALSVQRRWGVAFQQSALFSSLTVLENVMFPLREFSQLNAEIIREIALLKISLSGLEPEAAYKFPAELSGGMKKRAAVARALALDPELLFFDEPTAGLDPKSAVALDDLILHLRDALGLSIVIITHDVGILSRIADRIAFLGERKVLANLPLSEIRKNPHPLIQEYFSDTELELMPSD